MSASGTSTSMCGCANVQRVRLRVQELLSNPRFVVGEANRFDVSQGELGASQLGRTRPGHFPPHFPPLSPP